MKPASLLKRFAVPLLLLLAAVALLLGLPHPANAQTPGGSILIWPVDPIIEADERAAALWLENPGKGPITLQIRIYAWTQADGKNGYAEQDVVLGTPPIVTIAPGAKQLVRLTRTVPTPAAAESAYRVVIDEIPASNGERAPGAAVSFRMRYSIPLFTYGAGTEPPATATRPPAPKHTPPAPVLSWTIVRDLNGVSLEISNSGPVHARITQASLLAGTTRQPLAEGLLGYVLPGQAMRWPLAAGQAEDASLVAAVNGAAPAAIERRTR